jgi:hypothetical protein
MLTSGERHVAALEERRLSCESRRSLSGPLAIDEEVIPAHCNVVDQDGACSREFECGAEPDMHVRARRWPGV